MDYTTISNEVTSVQIKAIFTLVREECLKVTRYFCINFFLNYFNIFLGLWFLAKFSFILFQFTLTENCFEGTLPINFGKLKSVKNQFKIFNH